MIPQNKRLAGILIACTLLLLIPFIAMQFTDEVRWGLLDFFLMGAALFGIGLAFELIARKSMKKAYRVALGVALAGVFLLFWVNGAVGIIGSENQPANLLYFAIFAVAIIGALISRFKPRGMALTFFIAALIQLLIPVLAILIWPQVSWGGAGISGVFIMNTIFALLFAASGLLFRKAGTS